jgi:hypothetical protein
MRNRILLISESSYTQGARPGGCAFHFGARPGGGARPEAYGILPRRNSSPMLIINYK